jgi:hypothetical protein
MLPARWRVVRSLLALLLAAASCRVQAGQAEGFRFQIVTGDDSAITRRIADDLYKRLVPTFAVFRTELAQKRRMLYVAVGPTALRDVAARRCDCVVISAFTSSQVWNAVTAALPPARLASMTAVYAEPAPADQLQLVSLLYRRQVKVAAIVGSDTAFLKPALVGQVDVRDFAQGADINRTMDQVAPNEVLLALPDSEVYNPENIRNILLSTYRRKQGVIGFSADMVKAGALATTYSDIEDINAQVAEVAAQFVARGELAPPQFPRYFRTVVNEGVASSLDLAVGEPVRRFARAAPARP